MARKDGFSTGKSEHFDSAPTVVQAAGAGAVVIPDSIDLPGARFERVGSDLVVTGADGRQIVIEGYFTSTDPVPLRTLDGAVLDGGTVLRLAGEGAPIQVAQVGMTDAGGLFQSEPIGVVETASGSVEVLRTDGTQHRLAIGDRVFADDTIITGDGAAVGITLADQSSLALGEDGQLVLDEMVFDPDSQDGDLSLSVAQGVFTFVSGQIAKTSPEAMVVNTPVGTIGIRGTAAGVKVDAGSGQTTVALVKEANDFVGEITVSNELGRVTINKAGLATTISSGQQAPQSPFAMSASEFGRQFGGALNALPKGEILLDAETRDEAVDAYTQAQAEARATEAADLIGPENGPLAETGPTGPDEKGNIRIEETHAREDYASDPAHFSPVQAVEATVAGWQSAGIEAWGDLGDSVVLELGTFLVYSASGVNVDTTNVNGETVSVVTAKARDIAISGQVIDGYIKNATVFADANDNGVLDDGEAWTTTDDYGNYTLNNAVGTVTVTGGTDISTGLANEVVMTAPSGSTVVTPLTTLVASLMKGGTTSKADAEAAVKANFGISGDVDLSTFDPVSAAYSTDATVAANAAKVLASGVKVQNIAVQVSSALSGAGGSKQGVSDSVFDQIATKVNNGDSLADSTVLEDIIVQAASSESGTVDSAKVGAIAASAAGVIKDTVDTLDTQANSGKTGAEFLTEVAKVARVAQKDSADGISTAATAGDATAASDLATNYSKTELEAKVVEAAQHVGTVTTREQESVVTDDTLVGTDGADSLMGFGGADDISGGLGDDFIDGGGDDDVLKGGAGADTLLGKAGNDHLHGDLGNDTLHGGDGDDLIRGGQGDDLITGGDGIDTAVFAGVYRDYEVRYTATGVTVIDKQAGDDDEGTDTLMGVEILQFADRAISVTANAAPSAQNDAAQGQEDQAIVLRPLENDGDFDHNALSLLSITQPSHGEAVLGDDGTISYRPAANYFGQDSFTYTVSDGQGGTATAVIALDVAAVNDAPTAQDGSLSTNEDVAASGVLTFGDVDAADIPAARIVSGPAKGTLTAFDSATGAFTYTPDANANGTDSFTYRVGDGTAESDLATVSIQIAAVNDLPEATGAATSVAEDSAVSGILVAGDLDGDELTYAIVTGPTKGTVTITDVHTGAYTYTAAGNNNGADSFTFVATDGQGNSNEATVTVDIGAVNDVPTVSSQSLATTEDQAVDGILQAEDVDGDALTRAIVSGPQKGSLTSFDAATGAFTYTPDADANGTDSFTYRVNDGTVDSALATVTVAVAAVNDAPTADNVAKEVEENTALSISLSAQDVDSASLTYEILGDPAKGVVSDFNASTGTFTYTPDTNTTGLDSFTYRVSDGDAYSNTAALTLTILNGNDVPAGVDAALTTTWDTPITASLGVVDDSANLTFTLVDAPTNGVLNLTDAAAGAFTYTPSSTLPGTDSFSYRVSDGEFTSELATVNLTVDPVRITGYEDADAITVGDGSYLVTAQGGDDVITIPEQSGPFRDEILAGSGTDTLVIADADYLNPGAFEKREYVDGKFIWSDLDADGNVISSVTFDAETVRMDGHDYATGWIGYETREEHYLTFTQAVYTSQWPGYPELWRYTTKNMTYSQETGIAALFEMDGQGGMFDGVSGLRTVYGSMAGDVITGAYNAGTTIYGGGGNDRINALYGSGNWVDAGSGDDNVYIHTNTANLGTFYAHLDGGEGNDTLWVVSGNAVIDLNDTSLAQNFENVTFYHTTNNYASINSDDFAQGNGQANILDGGMGNDTLFGGGGDDVLKGGATITHRFWTFVDHGADYLKGEAGNDTLVGGYGEDTLDGGTGADSLYLNQDGDAVILRAGDGGAALAEADTVFDFSVSQDVIGLDGGLTRADLTLTQVDADTVIQITDSGEYLAVLKNVSLSLLAEDHFVNGAVDPLSLTGTDGDDTLTGGFGADTLDGGLGSDTLDGWKGDDVAVVSSQAQGEHDTFIGGPGQDTLKLSDDPALYQDRTYDGGQYVWSVLNGDGSVKSSVTFDAEVVSFGGNDYTTTWIDNARSADQLADTSHRYLTPFYDTQQAASGWGAIARNLTSSDASGIGYLFSTSQYGGLAEAQGTGLQTIYGSAGDDVITGATTEATTLLGGAGNDWINAFDVAGSVVDAGAGDDQVVVQTDLASLGGLYATLDGGAGNDTLVVVNAQHSLDMADLGAAQNFENIRFASLSGTAFVDAADTAQGNDANNTLDGGLGNDTLYGGGGDDVLYGGVTQRANSQDYVDGGDDKLYGEAGDDTLYGGNGDDVLDGGSGRDVLYLGDGGDYVILRAADADATVELADVVQDFDPTADYLALDGGLTQADLTLTQVGADTVIQVTASSDYLAVLKNVTASDLTGDHFTNGALTPLTLTGTDGDDSLAGGFGNDLLDGGLGSDLLSGWGGDDVATVSTQAEGDHDTFVGGAGRDILELVDAPETYQVRTLSGDLYTWSSLNQDGSVRSSVTFDAEVVRYGGDDYTAVLVDNARTADELAAYSHRYLSPYFESEQDLSNWPSVVRNLMSSDTSDTGYLFATAQYGGLADAQATGLHTIHGSASDDIITGATTNATTLLGGAGNDWINAFDVAGSVVDAGAGDDEVVVQSSLADLGSLYGTLDGGTGNDTLVLTNAEHSVDMADLGAAQNFENIRFASVSGTAFVNADDYALGTDADNTLDGGLGNDTLYGGGGDDVLLGGGTQRVDGKDYVDNGNDTLYGGAGNDTLVGANGHDTLDGGSGQDLLSLGNGNDYVVLRAADGAATVELADVIQDFKASEDFLALADGLTFGDLSIVQAGADTVIQDTVSNAYLAILKNVTATSLAVSNFLSAATDPLTVDGSDGNDVLLGGFGGDTLSGGLGSDTLYGQTGDDTFVYSGAQAGDADVIYGGVGTDVLKVDVAGWTDMAEFASRRHVSGQFVWSDLTADGSVKSSVTFDTEQVEFQGHRYANYFTGYNPTAWFKGYVYTYDFHSTLRYSPGSSGWGYSAANVTYSLSAKTAYLFENGGGGFIDGTFAGISTVYGTDLADSIRGNANDNVHIWGGGGNDIINPNSRYLNWVDAGSGNDTVYYHAGMSNVTLDGGSGIDTLGVMSVGTSIDMNDLGTITNFENVFFKTSVNGGIVASDNFVQGDAGNNVLDGGMGTDTLKGGGGDDTLYGGRTTYDTYNVPFFDYDGDFLFGQGGNDTLDGANGSDVLDGGTGADILSLGDGNDTVVLRPGDGGATLADADTILDFAVGGDVLALTGGLLYRDLNIFQGSGDHAADTVIQIASSGEYLAVLKNVAAGDVTYHSFTLSLTGVAPNTAPVAGSMVTVETDEDTATAAITLTGTDPDAGDAVQHFVLRGAPQHGTLLLDGAAVAEGDLVAAADVAAGKLTYRPDANYHGTDSFTYGAIDKLGEVSVNTGTIAVHVASVEDAPEAGAIAWTTAEDMTSSGVLRASDGDGDALTYTQVDGPAHGTLTAFDTATGVFTYRPDADYHGADSFTYTVTDGKATSSTATVTITIDGVNDVPVTTSVDFAATEDTAVTGQMLAGSDGDNDALTFEIVSGPSKGQFSFVDAATGAFTYTPDADANGTDVLTYRVTDGTGISNISTATFTIASQADAPVAADGAVTTNQDVALEGIVSASDGDGDALLFAVDSGPSNGALTLNGDGTYSYAPDGGFAGTDSFTYKVSDDGGSTYKDTGTVTITVTDIVDAPVSAAVSAATGEDTSIQVSLSATDADGNQTITYLEPTPTKGTISNFDAAAGTFTYTPDADANGIDVFAYQVRDSAGNLSNQATVSITIAPVADAPVVTDATVDLQEEQTVVGLLGATDAENDSLTYELVGATSHGQLTLDATLGSYVYTPDADFAGTDGFTYRVSDGTAWSMTATLTLDVANVNDAPVAVSDSLSVIEDGAVTGTLAASDADAGDTLTYLIATEASKGTVAIADAATGAYTYTPLANVYGDDTFTYRVFDGQAYSAEATVTVSITGVPDVPRAYSGALAVNEDTAATTYLFGWDADNDPLTYTLLSQPSNGTITLLDAATGRIRFDPTADWSGTDQFSYKVSDPVSGDSNVATVDLHVYAINDAPVATDDSLRALAGTELVLSKRLLTQNDTDQENDLLDITDVNTTDGTVSIVDGNVVFKAADGFTGQASFTYTLSDGNGGTDTGSVDVSVEAAVPGETSGDDVIVGSAAAEILAGGDGNDTLDGQGGDDIFYGGAGDDTFLFDSADVSGIHGGTGKDTLSFQAGGETLDLTTLNLTRQFSAVTDVECIDLTGTGNNSLALDLNDLLGMNDTANGFLAGTAYAGHSHALVVDGDAGDGVTLGGTWHDTGNDLSLTLEDGGSAKSFSVYESDKGEGIVAVSDQLSLST